MSIPSSLPDTFPCPRCGRELERNGVLSVEGHAVPLAVFQCDHCRQPYDAEEARRPDPLMVHLTFVVGPDGRPFDPADPEADLSTPPDWARPRAGSGGAGGGTDGRAD